MGKGGRWDLFEKAANASRIPWNGSEALKFIPGQPQRKISCAPEVFSACTVPLISGMGAFYMSRCIGIAAFSKRSQRPPTHDFKALNSYVFFKVETHKGLLKPSPKVLGRHVGR